VDPSRDQSARHLVSDIGTDRDVSATGGTNRLKVVSERFFPEVERGDGVSIPG
jgi:hypothetical protein